MQIILRESSAKYGTAFEFGYSLWATRDGDTLEAVHEAGFLPYSLEHPALETYYMARSARIRLGDFALTSENRRIKNKFADLNLAVDELKPEDLLHDAAALDFCIRYFDARHGVGTFTRERLIYVLGFTDTTVVRYRKDGMVAAYVIERRSGTMRHYYYSFYDLSLINKSFGVFLMLDCLEKAKAAGVSYVYLGTLYGEKALYKTNFEPLEYWDGNGWNSDIVKLKELARADVKK